MEEQLNVGSCGILTPRSVIRITSKYCPAAPESGLFPSAISLRSLRPKSAVAKDAEDDHDEIEVLLMQAFDNLSRTSSKFIYDKGWPSLTNIHSAAIKQVANTDHNLILSPRLHQGKPKAAFIPALNVSKIGRRG
jgi:hypothetical protein